MIKTNNYTNNTNINDTKRGLLPIISWRRSYSISNNNNNPVLAVGSSKIIQLVEIYINDEKLFQQTRDTSLIKMRGIGQIHLKQPAIAMKFNNFNSYRRNIYL